MSVTVARIVSRWPCVMLALAAAGCGKGRVGGGDDGGAAHVLGGTLSGLTSAGLVLQNNGRDDLAVAALDSSFAFTAPLATGASYLVTIKTQPTAETCTVSSGAGTMPAADVVDIAVTCTPRTFTIGGTVSGLAGASVVLRNNGSDDLTQSGDGPFTFAIALPVGAAFAVTVQSAPPWQTCTVSAGTGVVSDGPVNTVAVSCQNTAFSIGGTVSGLTGAGLVLRNNGGDDLGIAGNGPFTFLTSLIHNAGYDVTVGTRPIGQQCSITGGSGTLAAANVTNVAVTCIANPYSVGGGIVGLLGSGLVLQNNGGDDLGASGSTFAFAQKLGDGDAYKVTVKTHPTAQRCVVLAGTGSVTGASVTSVTVSCADLLGAVAPFYPGNGAAWNDYVKNDGASTLAATDTACVGNETGGYSACLHGGEMRAAVATGRASCTGLTATDELGAFAWVCETSTGVARFVSTGLRGGKSLADLIDFGAPSFADNSVDIFDGGLLFGATPPGAWWSNPLVVDNDGGSLSAAGTIYLATSPVLVTGYTVDASHIGFVGKPGVIIYGPKAGSGSVVVKADASFLARDFLWVEGRFDAAGDEAGVLLRDVRFSVAHHVQAEGATYGAASGVYLYLASNNLVTQVVAAHEYSGVYLFLASNNTLLDITATDNTYGVHLDGADNNVIADVAAHTNSSYGVYVHNASAGNRLSRLAAANNAMGVYLSTTTGNRISDVMLADNQTGLRLASTTDSVFEGITAVSNGYGIQATSSANNVFAAVTTVANTYGISLAAAYTTLLNVVTAHNSSDGLYIASGGEQACDLAVASNNYGIFLNNSSNNVFTGLLKVGSNSVYKCFVSGGTNPGLVNSTCANQGASDATLSADAYPMASFVGRVAIDDAANASDTSGAAPYASLTDWVRFATPWRAWGVDNSSFPPGAAGPCSAGTCRIFDYGLVVSDTSLRAAAALPTGNDTLTHTWSNASTTTFLRRALEVSGDGVGNDNLLCESGETCVYMPNLASYQGHGSLISAGAFADGTITGVTLQMYETNGY